MENLTVEDIVRESNGKLILGDKKFICRKFSKDTRRRYLYSNKRRKI